MTVICTEATSDYSLTKIIRSLKNFDDDILLYIHFFTSCPSPVNNKYTLYLLAFFLMMETFTFHIFKKQQQKNIKFLQIYFLSEIERLELDGLINFNYFTYSVYCL